MKSIHSRLVVALLASLTVLLGAGGAAVYFVTRAVLARDFDMMLRAAVPEAAARVGEQLQERLAADRLLPLELRREPPLYVQVWLPEGRVLGRSAALEGIDLPMQGPESGREQWLGFTLTNGRPARALVVRLDPRIEGRREAPGHVTSHGGGGATDPPVLTGQTRPEVEPRRSPRPDPARTGQLRGYPQALVILVAAEQAELFAALQRLSLVLWGVGFFLLAATALVVTVVSRRGLAPLQSVAEQASRIDASKLDVRFPAADLPTELGSICLRLNDLLSRLEDSFARERCFSADVAHELRTPIAELRSLAEVALKWPSGDPTVVSAFEDALAIAVQMQGIVTGLLGIARCEAGTQVIAREPVVVAELVRSAWQPFEVRANAKGLRVRMELPELDPIETDRAMLGVVVTNLLSNAVEYTPPSGAIEFRLQSNGPGLDLGVANSVENITAADLPHFFDRFWRKDTARSSSEHSGIGLAVSRAYALALGLDLRASLPTAGWLMMELRSRV